jgi:hypothetical protein
LRGVKKFSLNILARISNEEDFLKSGIELSKTFNLPMSSLQVHEEEHLIYKTTMNLTDDVRLSLLFMGMYVDHSTNLIINLETENEQGLITIAQIQNELKKKLDSLGLLTNWNVMVQGILASGFSDQKRLNKWLVQNLDIKEIDQYEDSGTISVSYFSPKIRTIIQSGSKKMNLQLAIHKNSVTDQWRVTIGTPIITIEY